MKKVKTQLLSDAAKDELLDHIRKNYGRGNNKLPTEEQLSQMLGVSRITIRTALNDLANEGIVFRRQGKGTFVNVQALNIKVQFSPVILFNEMIQRGGYVPSARVLQTSMVKADDAMAELLWVQPGEDLVLVKKMFYASNTPCAYCEDYFPAAIMQHPDDLKLIDDYTDSLFDFLNVRCGKKIEWDRVEILTASAGEARHVGAAFGEKDPAKSYLLLEQVNFGGGDAPLVYALEYIDTDYIRFNSIRQKRL